MRGTLESEKEMIAVIDIVFRRNVWNILAQGMVVVGCYLLYTSVSNTNVEDSAWRIFLPFFLFTASCLSCLRKGLERAYWLPMVLDESRELTSFCM